MISAGIELYETHKSGLKTRTRSSNLEVAIGIAPIFQGLAPSCTV